jgi:chromosome segregation ATPase
MLEQYDRRVKALENELATIGQNVNAQLMSKDEMLKQLQDQVTLWRNKYEALAKLYSQLRTEHLDMLAKYKQMQIKAGSAQEAIDKMERMERDVKAKNLELADMIRERDRARFDLDRIKASQKEEFDRLKRDLMFANERAEDATRSKSSEMSGIMATLNRQIAELEDALREKRNGSDDLLRRLDEKDAELARLRDEQAAELAIMQEGMDATIKQMSEMQLGQGAQDEAVNAQIDTLILDNSKKLNAIIDSILQVRRAQLAERRNVLTAPTGLRGEGRRCHLRARVALGVGQRNRHARVRALPHREGHWRVKRVRRRLLTLPLGRSRRRARRGDQARQRAGADDPRRARVHEGHHAPGAVRCCG